MSTTDGAINQNHLMILEGLYYCLVPKTDLEMKHRAPTKILFIIFSTNQSILSILKHNQ